MVKISIKKDKKTKTKTKAKPRQKQKQKQSQKKEIKKQEILDEISDDDTPIEKVKIPVKKEPSLKVKTSKTLYFD